MESTTIERLRAELAREKERRRAEKEKRREEEGKRREEEGKRREEEDKRQAAEASLEELKRLTTFSEYLELLQKHHAAGLSYDPDCPRNTRGGVTNPRHRITPTVITPWQGFEDDQAATYRELCEAFRDKRLFPTESQVIGAQKTINEFLITSEKGLTNFSDVAEVAPIKEINNQFLALAQIDGDQALEVSFSPRGDPDEDSQVAFRPVDGVWICGGPKALDELKTPHKLREETLQTALDDGTGRFRRRFETKPIIDSPHASNDPTYTVVAVFTQIFDYMVTTGVARARLYTGMASVYFQIPLLEPTTLQYYLKTHPRSSTVNPEETSVCQNAVFVRRCLSMEKRDADWIRNAVDSNARFLVDPEAQLNLMSSSPLSITPEIVSPGREDYKAPKRKRLSSPEFDRSYRRTDDTSEDDAGDDSSPIRRRPATRSRTRERDSRHGPAAISTTSGSGRTGGTRSSSTTGRMGNAICTLCAPPPTVRQYCSQACLRGLRYSSCTNTPRQLDMACPNAIQHSKSGEHELTLVKLRDLLKQQLARTHTHAIEYVGLGGSSGHLFKITLCSHGYTFVGKGSRSDQVPTLRHELGIYESIHPLQGNAVPVCLGLLELKGPYYLPSPNHLTHFLLLSFGGFRLSRWSKLLPPADEVISSAVTALKKLHAFNLTHRDFCVENLLWSTELHSVMIVDFGKSILLEIPDIFPSVRHNLSSGQKRHRRVVQGDVKLRSSAGVQKNRKRRYRHRELKFLMGERQCELADVEMEVLRRLPMPAT